MHKGWYKELDEDDENGFAQFGGYMQAKKAKLIKQVREQAGAERHSAIFQGISIHVNGFTKPSAEELKTLMGLHGGIYHVYQMPSTTHIIASNLPNVKINKLGPLPIVKPSWIEDSITLGRLLDYANYLLYTNQSRTQPKINFEKVSVNASNVSKTASDPSFLSEFYGNSRLHLIATLGAEFKQFVNDLRAETPKNYEFPGVCLLCTTNSKTQQLKKRKRSDEDLALSFNTESGTKGIQQADVIMHIDMDCFFVSVGIRNRPELKGKPIAVTHAKTTGQRAQRPGVDRSVEIAMYKERLPEGATFRLQDIDDNSSLSEIASCSYEARRQGVKNGMFMGQALKLCPTLQAIPYDFDDYKQVSKILYTTIAEYTLCIEAVSCDEMYVNITSVLKTCNISVDMFAEHIRSVIKQRTGCPCSTGFGSNRLQARLATKRAKPDGYYYLLPADVLGYFNDMPLEELPGVGRALLGKLKHLGLETCGDVQMFSLQVLQKELGTKVGETIKEQAAGVDKKPLQYEHERKSVSAEVNYGIRFKTQGEAVEFLQRLADEVTGRLVDIGMRAKGVTLKLMVRAEDAPTETAKYLGHGICDSVSKSVTLTTATDDCKIISAESHSLLVKMAVPFDELRGVGIQLTKLEKAAQMNVLLKNFLASNFQASKTRQQVEHNEIKISSPEKPEDKKQTKGVARGRGRGRPAKGSSKVLTQFFKSQKDRDREVKTNPTKTTTDVNVKDIDLSVLQELPDDIRLEIMQQYNMQLQQDDTFKSSQTPGGSTSENTVVVPVVEKSVSKRKSKAKLNSSTGFDSLTHENFMSMLANWFQTAKPLKIDVEMLGEYFKEMATQRKIERLYSYIKYLHRNIDEKRDCEWHKAYFKMCESLQEGMMSTYCTKLRLPENFACESCGRKHS